MINVINADLSTVANVQLYVGEDQGSKCITLTFGNRQRQTGASFTFTEPEFNRLLRMLEFVRTSNENK